MSGKDNYYWTFLFDFDGVDAYIHLWMCFTRG